MSSRNSQNHLPVDWSRLKDRLVYLPGAAILAYGFWLALSV
jgi:hypothetical protein